MINWRKLFLRLLIASLFCLYIQWRVKDKKIRKVQTYLVLSIVLGQELVNLIWQVIDYLSLGKW
ncbi:hypothetical protein [Streptococcus cuniculipharyngis]|uniref:Uncharacterized protein n=1 Tax=Streptococcus cuniculipharyngis TaxID=1562651 RepID=A0A5C5SBH3_9STRE|nr:hypothetical protein [Streptococcus cuniculipharyngis]TWS96445.1 hypothetical protein FRX57_07050 [Streptococcus cuniculipharyngis]